MREKNCIMLIEWPEKGKKIIPKSDLIINFFQKENFRKIVLYGNNDSIYNTAIDLRKHNVESKVIDVRASGVESDIVLEAKNLGIEVFQGFAIFPGVSRSGATLTISRFLGLEREEASRYSFLLSLPIILGGFVTKLPELAHEGSAVSWGTCFWGTFISFIVGLLSIHLFLKLIQNLGLGIYAFYRVLLAGVILWVL